MLKAIGGNMTMVKFKNRELILNVIKNNGAVSRVDIAHKLQLTPASITILVNDMIKEGFIKELGLLEYEEKRSGRKKILIDIDYSYKYAMGINIEPELINIGVSNIKGDIVASRRFNTDKLLTPQGLLSQISSECMNILWKENIMKDKILGVGVGIVGLVDKINGISKHAYGLWNEEVQVKKILEESIGTRVIVDNNVRALALGEIDYQSNEDMSNVLFVKYGPGVGSAIIIDNEIYYGANNYSGEIGHTIVNYYGEMCRCGRKGCLETVASRSVIIDKTKKQFSEKNMPELYKLCEGNIQSIDLGNICRAAENGDDAVLKIIEEAIFYMSVAIANAVSLYDPHNVILYGEAFKYNIIVDKLKDYMKEFIINRDTNKFISVSKLTYKSNYIGGIALALREFFYNTGGM